LLDDQLHPDSGGQVHHDIGPAGELRDERVIQHRPLAKREPLVFQEVANVLDRSRGNVVQGDDGVTSTEQRVREV
jgi:hypothetical protein